MLKSVRYREMVYTGPVDEFFDYRFGKLPYRSLQFRHETLDVERLQPVAVINYPNEHDYTRVTEFKHLTGQTHAKTSVVYEYPCDGGDPYYPVPRAENAALYKQYEALAAQHAETCISPAGWRRTSTTTWTRWWPGTDAVRASSPAHPGRLSLASPVAAGVTASRRSNQQRVDLADGRRIEFHPAVIGHQPVDLLLHVVELRIADAGDLRDARRWPRYSPRMRVKRRFRSRLPHRNSPTSSPARSADPRAERSRLRRIPTAESASHCTGGPEPSTACRTAEAAGPA